MRDEKRIPETLEQIKAIWEQYPDLRLGQLILNATNGYSRAPLFYMEDDQLVNVIQNFYKGLKNE